MCGIIGAAAGRDVQAELLTALSRMEYRGYDSAGICVDTGESFCAVKAAGKLAALRDKLAKHPCSGSIGIGHTRWATHGAPTEENAHPHLSESAAIVHNGIIENFADLKARLQKAGATFRSETDTEVVPHLLAEQLRGGKAPKEAWQSTLAELHGSYALAGILQGDATRLWFARRGSPLLLARRDGAAYVASDALAIVGFAEEVLYLGEGQWGWIGPDGIGLFDAEGNEVVAGWEPMPLVQGSVDKGGYAHYMEKEIHEQPEVLDRILRAYVRDGEIEFPQAAFLASEELPRRIVMVACGTSYHAALTARYWLERYLKIPVEVDVASEYRYRDPVIGPDTLLITLSQSGETADTLEALRLFKGRTPENRALAICNVPTASLPRESDGLIQLYAGPEVGVASTKAYLAQLAVLALLALLLARRAEVLDAPEVRHHLQGLHAAVDGIRGILAGAAQVKAAVPYFVGARGALYLGRGPSYPLALEGALKLKEISYLHAEGYAAGEMKHGPIALIDQTLPVVVIAPKQYHLEKVLSNLQEVQARGARVILITDLDVGELPENIVQALHIPEGDYFSTPLLAAVPLQLLAYQVACAMGTDVDQPRNLAKSVTVE